MTQKTTYGYSEKDYQRFTHYAWRYLIAFSVLYCCLYCTRLNLANASAALIDALHYSKADIGLLTATLFWAYALGQFINGRLSEVFSAKIFILASVLLSVFANGLMCLQTTLTGMLVIWAVNGYAQSMAWGPGVSVLTRWWPGNRRGFATGMIHAFSGFGTLAATLSVAFAFNSFGHYGWQSAFLIPALLPLAALLIFVAVVKYKPQDIGLNDYVESSSSKATQESINRSSGTHFFEPYRLLFSNKKFLVWFFILFSIGIVRYGLIIWIPLYFINAFKINITAGLLQTVALPLGMGLGSVLVPALSDRYCPDNRLAPAFLCAFIAAVAVLLMNMLNPVEGIQAFLVQVFLFAAGFCIYAINGTAWAYGTDVGGRQFSATSVGVLDFSEYMGAAFQSVLFGLLIDWIGWHVVFYTIGTLCALIGVLSFLFSRK